MNAKVCAFSGIDLGKEYDGIVRDGWLRIHISSYIYFTICAIDILQRTCRYFVLHGKKIIY